MNPTRIVIEPEMSRSSAEREYPRFLSSARAAHRQGPSFSELDAQGEAGAQAGVHLLLDELAAAIDAFTDQLVENGTALGSTVQGTIRIVATRTFLVPDPAKGSFGAEPVFVISASLLNLGETPAFSPPIGESRPRRPNRPPWLFSLPAARST